MPRHFVAFPLIVLLIAFAAPAWGQAQDLHYTTWREAIPGNAPATNIMFRSTGTDTIVVDSIQLRSCQNVDEGCFTVKPRLIVAPGRTVTLMRYSAQARNMPYGLDYTVWTRARPVTVATGRSAVKQEMTNGVAGATAAAPGDRPAIVHSGPVVNMIVQPITDPAAFTALVPPTPEKEKGDCEEVLGGINQPGDHVYALAWVQDHVVLRTVKVEFDSTWRVYRYEEMRALPRTDKQPGPPLLRTNIRIRGVDGTAEMQNTNDATGEAFALTAPNLLDAPSLGVPATMAAQIIKRCAHHTPPATIALIPVREAPLPTRIRQQLASHTATVTSDGNTTTAAATVVRTAPASSPPATTADGKVGLITGNESKPIVLRTITDPKLFTPAVPLLPGDARCVRMPIIESPDHHHEYAMAWINDAKQMVRQVSISVDPTGKLLSYVENRYGEAPAAGTPRPQTIIKIINGPQQASLMNVGGGRDPEGFSLFEADVASEKAIDAPSETVAKIVDVCGGPS